jgi:hypothetical protein
MKKIALILLFLTSSYLTYTFFHLETQSNVTLKDPNADNRNISNTQSNKKKFSQFNKKNKQNREPSSMQKNRQDDDYFYEPDMENPYLQAAIKKYNATTEVYYNQTNYFLSDYGAIKTNAFNSQLGEKIEEKYGKNAMALDEDTSPTLLQPLDGRHSEALIHPTLI